VYVCVSFAYALSSKWLDELRGDLEEGFFFFGGGGGGKVRYDVWPHALLLSSQPYLDRGARKLLLNHRI
jgi:hypothetical protein